MDLVINYDNGSMVVHLEAFLDCRSISKVRKLVKLIPWNYNPDAVDKLKEYVEQQIEQFEPRMKEDANYYVGYKSKLQFGEGELKKYLSYRDRLKRNTDSWKHYNELVKQFRQEVKEIKALMKQRKTDFDQCVRNKAFYQKVLENIA